MGTGSFTDDFKRDAVAQITERGLPDQGGCGAARGQPAFALCVEAQVREGGHRRDREGYRDPSFEARAGAEVGGAGHLTCHPVVPR